MTFFLWGKSDSKWVVNEKMLKTASIDPALEECLGHVGENSMVSSCSGKNVEDSLYRPASIDLGFLMIYDHNLY